MYNNPYMQSYPTNFNQQNLNERIDSQIAQLQQMKEQVKNQQPAINQTFQLAPTTTNIMRYVNSIDDVNKETVFVDTPFFSKDLSVMWLKNSKGEIKSYELSEIVQKDEKDIQIELLMSQINELKGIIKNEQFNTNDIGAKVTTNTSKLDDTNGTTVENEKPTSVSRVSKSKK